MIIAAQVGDFLFAVFGHAGLGIFSAELAVDQAGLALLTERPLLLIECLARDAEVATGHPNVAGLVSVVEV